MKNYFLILTIAIGLSACNGNKIYSKFDKDFDENRWNRNDVRTFEFSVEKEQEYDLIIDFSHVYGYQFDKVPLKMVLTDSAGNKTVEQIKLDILNDEGHDNGNCDGDYCDLYDTVFQNQKLKPGKYKVEVTNEFNHEYLPNVIGLGIQVLISKK